MTRCVGLLALLLVMFIPTWHPPPRRVGSGSEAHGTELTCEAFAEESFLHDLRRAAAGPVQLHTVFGNLDDLPPVARLALEGTVAGRRHEPPDRVHVFTDGSAAAAGSEDRCAWAIVVIAQYKDDYTLWGALSDTVSADLGPLLMHGPHDSNKAELLAVRWALTWTLLETLVCEVVIESDSLFAIHSTQGVWNAGQLQDLASANFDLLALAQQTGRLTFAHVRGHDLHPWNELADGLARRAGAGRQMPPLAPLTQELGRLRYSKWEWLREAGAVQRGAYPRISGKDLAFHGMIRETEVSLGLGAATQAHAAASEKATLVLATYNARTLTCRGTGTAARAPADRPALLRRQMRMHGVLAAGIQEARTHAGMRIIDDFLVVSSGGEGGQLGCELWLDLTRTLGTHGDQRGVITAKACTVALATPRLLVVTVTAPRLKCTLAVAHAPHSGAEAHIRATWWEELVSALAKFEHVVLLIDANARLGTVESVAVGTGGFAQSEDDNGRAFHAALLELGLWVPATFAPRDEQAFTWTTPTGRPHRLDYVAVPIAWKEWCDARDGSTMCAVLHDFDTLAKGEDHRPAVVRLMTTVARGTSGTRWRPPRYCESALRCPLRGETFRAALSAMPTIDWTLGVDRHAKVLAGRVQEAAEQAFGGQQRRPRRPYISDEVLELVLMRRRVRRWLRGWKVVEAVGGGPAFSGRLRMPPVDFLVAVVESWQTQCPSEAAVIGATACRLRRIPPDCPHQQREEDVCAALAAFTRNTRGRVAWLLRRDRAAFLERVAGPLRREDASAAAIEVAWKAVRTLMAFAGKTRWCGPRPLPVRRKADGGMATNPEEVAMVALQHFAHIEAAEILAPP